MNEKTNVKLWGDYKKKRWEKHGGGGIDMAGECGGS